VDSPDWLEALPKGQYPNGRPCLPRADDEQEHPLFVDEESDEPLTPEQVQELWSAIEEIRVDVCQMADAAKRLCAAMCDLSQKAQAVFAAFRTHAQSTP
jgi:hypothetical protein